MTFGWPLVSDREGLRGSGSLSVLPKFLHQQWIDESESTRQFISCEEESRVLRVAAESFLQLKLAERMEFPLSKKKKLAERMDAGYRLTDEAPSKFFLTFQIKKKDQAPSKFRDQARK